MKEQLISFDVAKLTKEIGFNELVLDCYRTDGDLYDGNTAHLLFKNKQLVTTFCSAPTQSFLQKWIREVYHIDVFVTCNASGWFWEVFGAYPTNGGTHIMWSNDDGPNDGGCWETYEEAMDDCLLHTLNYIKTKNK